MNLKRINKELEKQHDKFKRSFIEKVANKMEYNQEKDIFEVKMEELEKFKPKQKPFIKKPSYDIMIKFFILGFTFAFILALTLYYVFGLRIY